MCNVTIAIRELLQRFHRATMTHQIDHHLCMTILLCTIICIPYITIVSLTAIDDLAEQILAAQEIPRRAVPPAIPELVLALGDGQIGALHQRRQNAGILAHQAPLLAAQRRVHAGIHVHDAGGQRRNVVRFARFGDAPVWWWRCGHGRETE